MVTGHRPERLKNLKADSLQKWFNEQLDRLKPSECICGMAQGTDQIFGFCVVEKGIPLINALPFKRTSYCEIERDLMERAKDNKIICDSWSKQCYYIRDVWMVDHSDVVLVVWDGKPNGGSYITMEYAKKKKKRIILFPFSENLVS